MTKLDFEKEARKRIDRQIRRILKSENKIPATEAIRTIFQAEVDTAALEHLIKPPRVVWDYPVPGRGAFVRFEWEEAE